jgi:aminoglycoside phosphotransferase (APT) family kinase protein
MIAAQVAGSRTPAYARMNALTPQMYHARLRLGYAGPMDAALALKLVGGQFPELAPTRATPLGGRLVRSFRIDDAATFRFPVSRAGEARLDAEIALLAALAAALPVAVPDHRFRGSPAGDHPFRFAGHPSLEGKSAYSLGAGAAQTASLGAELGRALAALAAFPVPAAWAAGIRLVRAPNHNVAAVYRDLLTQYQTKRPKLDPALVTQCDRLLQGMAIPAPHMDAAVLVHGAIAPDVVYLGARMGLCGWGEVNFGDPAVDFGHLRFWFGDDGLRSALEAAGREDLSSRARFISQCMGLSIIVDPSAPGEAKLLAVQRVS